MTTAHGPPAEKKAGGSHHGSGLTTGLPRATVLTVSFVLSLGIGFLAPIARASRHSIGSELDLSVERPGPHDFAVRDHRARLAQQSRPSQPTSTFVTTRTSLCTRRVART